MTVPMRLPNAAAPAPKGDAEAEEIAPDAESASEDQLEQDATPDPGQQPDPEDKTAKPKPRRFKDRHEWRDHMEKISGGWNRRNWRAD